MKLLGLITGCALFAGSLFADDVIRFKGDAATFKLLKSDAKTAVSGPVLVFKSALDEGTKYEFQPNAFGDYPVELQDGRYVLGINGKDLSVVEADKNAELEIIQLILSDKALLVGGQEETVVEVDPETITEEVIEEVEEIDVEVSAEEAELIEGEEEEEGSGGAKFKTILLVAAGIVAAVLIADEIDSDDDDDNDSVADAAADTAAAAAESTSSAASSGSASVAATVSSTPVTVSEPSRASSAPATASSTPTTVQRTTVVRRVVTRTVTPTVPPVLSN